MSRLGILQPGKLGDILICLPIAKHYSEMGYEVIWPIFTDFVPMMKESIDYVTFTPVTNDVYRCINEARYTLREYFSVKPEKIFDIAATFPGSRVTEEYVALGDGFGEEKFDQFKYRKCNVPFDKKWNLQFKRDEEKEKEIYNLYVNRPNYDIVSVKHSRGELNVKFESKNQIIHTNDKHNIFHWVKILEGAQNIALVDSAMSNFVEQLNLPNKKILLRKPGHPGPTFRNNWIIKEV